MAEEYSHRVTITRRGDKPADEASSEEPVEETPQDQEVEADDTADE